MAGLRSRAGWRMTRDLREDALAIWQAGVAAVDAKRLVQHNLRVDGRTLSIADEDVDLDRVGRIIVVGAGKAGAAMVAGVEAALGPKLMDEKDVVGWVNVPADTVPQERRADKHRIRLHPARPAGLNEPTPEGVQGTEEILRLVQSAGPTDLCICLISGGGSALLPAPAAGVSLEDKLAITRILSSAGANIQQLNTVRIALSRVKGGGLAAACNAGEMYSLIISDVLGDPLELIASGPTVQKSITPADALRVLQAMPLQEDARGTLHRVQEFLQSSQPTVPLPPRRSDLSVRNIVIGNLAVAVDGAGLEAERRGYEFAMHVARELEGEANDVGARLAKLALQMRGDGTVPNCLIHGGEPVVTLSPNAGKGGRNQQLVLAAYVTLQSSLNAEASAFDDIIVLSGGTDGEDGPTDAAGAFVDGRVHRAALDAGLDAAEFLARNDAYHFFAATGGLIKTGPTGTNVGDVRVISVRR